MWSEATRRQPVRLHRRRAEQLRRRSQRRAVRVPERWHRRPVAGRRDVRAVDPTDRRGGPTRRDHRDRDRRDRLERTQRPRLRTRRPPVHHRPRHVSTVGPRAVAHLRARRERTRSARRRTRSADVPERDRHRGRRQRGVGRVVHRNGPSLPAERVEHRGHRHVAGRPPRRRRSRRRRRWPAVRHHRQRRRDRRAQRRRNVRPVHRGRNDPDELCVRRVPLADDRRRSDRRHSRCLVHGPAVDDRDRHRGRSDVDRLVSDEGGRT